VRPRRLTGSGRAHRPARVRAVRLRAGQHQRTTNSVGGAFSCSSHKLAQVAICLLRVHSKRQRATGSAALRTSAPGRARPGPAKHPMCQRSSRFLSHRCSRALAGELAVCFSCCHVSSSTVPRSRGAIAEEGDSDWSNALPEHVRPTCCSADRSLRQRIQSNHAANIHSGFSFGSHPSSHPKATTPRKSLRRLRLAR